ncbi:MAG TPA: response regulator [Methylomirabilota bacterium]|nr:response regulator [Methylomirabilota bacterium]
MADLAPAPTVLIVDDEEEVRAFTRDVLEMDGYAVLEAASAARALELGEAHPGALDLLITDVVMPGMTGPELARRLRARRPALRVLCISGYPESADRRVEGVRSWTAWLEKPFSPDALLAAVRACLTG